MIRITRIFSRTNTKNWNKCYRLVPLKMFLYRPNYCTSINGFFRRYTFYPARFLSTSNGPIMSCWNCEHSYPIHGHGGMAYFCPSCKVVQQPWDEQTYFDVMHCEQKFDLDPKVLTDNFRKLQSQLHPDKFTLKSEREQNYSSLQSSIVNEAYQTLLKPLSRGIYLLSIEGLPLEDGNIAIGVDFLTSIMEMNETVENGSGSQLNKLRILNEGNLEQCIREASEAFRNGDLTTAKEVLSKMKYYDNINEQIKEKLME